MQSRALFALLTLILLLAVAPAHARQRVPVIDHSDIPLITGSGKVLTRAQARDTIRNGGKRQVWVFQQVDDSHMTGSLTWGAGGKHTIMVDIEYSERAYSITYKDSVNMKFRAVEQGEEWSEGLGIWVGKTKKVLYIHPFYNRNVNTLMDAIRIEAGNL